jgi:hypothetical protein
LFGHIVGLLNTKFDYNNAVNPKNVLHTEHFSVKLGGGFDISKFFEKNIMYAEYYFKNMDFYCLKPCLPYQRFAVFSSKKHTIIPPHFHKK